MSWKTAAWCYPYHNFRHRLETSACITYLWCWVPTRYGILKWETIIKRFRKLFYRSHSSEIFIVHLLLEIWLAVVCAFSWTTPANVCVPVYARARLEFFRRNNTAYEETFFGWFRKKWKELKHSFSTIQNSNTHWRRTISCCCSSI